VHPACRPCDAAHLLVKTSFVAELPPQQHRGVTKTGPVAAAPRTAPPFSLRFYPFLRGFKPCPQPPARAGGAGDLTRRAHDVKTRGGHGDRPAARGAHAAGSGRPGISLRTARERRQDRHHAATVSKVGSRSVTLPCREPRAYGSGGGGSSGAVRRVVLRFRRSSFRTTSHGQYVSVHRPSTSTV